LIYGRAAPAQPPRAFAVRCARRSQALAAAMRECAAAVRQMQLTFGDGLARAEASAARAEERAEERAGALRQSLADHWARADARCDSAERLMARVAVAVGATEGVSAGDDEEDRKRLKVCHAYK
jgi:hypothetical protein